MYNNINLINLVLKKIKKYIKKYNNINFLILISGGLDSTVLLNILNFIRDRYIFINLKAIYINHNLNFEYIKYKKFIYKICKNLNIIVYINNIYINRTLLRKHGIENFCRILRYKSIYNIFKNKYTLITAHHKNDVIETFFISLFRGCSITGLSSIKEENYIFNNNILRPFLEIEKKNILKYAYNNKIKWINDKSNKDNNIKRNFIRNILLPKIYNKWPNVINSIFNSINICKKQYDILKYKFKKFKIENFIDNKNRIIIKNILKINNDYYINLIILKWLKYFNIHTTYKKSDLIYKNIILSKNNKSSINIKNKLIYKKNKLICCI